MAVAGLPTIPVSGIPLNLFGAVEYCEFPAETTQTVPDSVAFCIAICSISLGSTNPADAPKLIFITSAPWATESSIAAAILSENADW